MQHDQCFTGSHWTPPSGDYSLHIAQAAARGCQSNYHHNNDATCTHFAGRFDGHCDAAVLYRVHCLMEEVRGFHKSH
jgi:hypothetical protein